jgi:hypothetical protein
MSANREQYTELFDQLLTVEADIKELNGLKKEKIELFAEQFGMNKKAIKKAFASYKEFLKSESEFHEIDGDTDLILGELVGKREVA